MKLLFLSCLEDYSYNFQGSSELISITITVPLFFLAECSYKKEFPSGILKNFLQLQSHDLMEGFFQPCDHGAWSISIHYPHIQ